MPEPSKKRTPSARVLAARVLLDRLREPYPTTEALSLLFGSKVSLAKREKVMEQHQKLMGSFQERMRKILLRFANPPPKKKPDNA